MQDLRLGNYIVMNEEYDRREFDRAGCMSDQNRVYVCCSQDEEIALPRTGYHFLKVIASSQLSWVIWVADSRQYTSVRTIGRCHQNRRIITVPMFVLAAYTDVYMLRTIYTHIRHNYKCLFIFKSLTYLLVYAIAIKTSSKHDLLCYACLWQKLLHGKTMPCLRLIVLSRVAPETLVRSKL